jgi:hypothetical protein
MMSAADRIDEMHASGNEFGLQEHANLIKNQNRPFRRQSKVG